MELITLFRRERRQDFLIGTPCHSRTLFENLAPFFSESYQMGPAVTGVTISNHQAQTLKIVQQENDCVPINAEAIPQIYLRERNAFPEHCQQAEMPPLYAQWLYQSVEVRPALLRGSAKEIPGPDRKTRGQWASGSLYLRERRHSCWIQI